MVQHLVEEVATALAMVAEQAAEVVSAPEGLATAAEVEKRAMHQEDVVGMVFAAVVAKRSVEGAVGSALAMVFGRVAAAVMAQEALAVGVAEWTLELEQVVATVVVRLAANAAAGRDRMRMMCCDSV